MGMRRSGLFVNVPQNQRKTRAHRDQVPNLVPEYKVSTLYFVACFTEAEDAGTLVKCNKNQLGDNMTTKPSW